MTVAGTTLGGMNTRVVVIVGSVVAVALVGVMVALFFVLGEMRGQAERQAYEDCMASFGFPVDAGPPPGLSDEDFERHLGALADAADYCR